MSGGCRLTLTVGRARDSTEIEAAKRLRVRVFCEEQRVSRAEELDGLDDEATHIVARDESGVVATCRLRAAGDACKLERMAVEARLRGQGAGGVLLEAAEREAAAMGAAEVVLHAQTRAQGFYAAHGYIAEEGTFLEAGIEHVRMTKRLPEEG